MRINPSKKIISSKSDKSYKKLHSADAGVFSRIMALAIGNVEETKQLNESELEELFQLHDQFITTVNHEINNPLCIVQGITELIKGKEHKNLKNKILASTDNITDEIKIFAQHDIPTIGKQCKNSPISEITFREDLLGCYLAKTIGPLTSVIRQSVEDIEKMLNIYKSQSDDYKIEVDKVKKSLLIIHRHANRIRVIITKLEELLPGDIEVTKYAGNLKMVRLK